MLHQSYTTIFIIEFFKILGTGSDDGTENNIIDLLDLVI